jgi:hypothetical protein
MQMTREALESAADGPPLPPPPLLLLLMMMPKDAGADGMAKVAAISLWLPLPSQLLLLRANG